MRKLIAMALLVGGVAAANAQVLTLVDGDTFNADSTVTLDNNPTAAEYSTAFANGGGTGFGGTLGNGTIRMEATLNNMFFGFNNAAALNDLMVILIDSRAGGFTDATMSDNADSGRRVITNPIANGTLGLPGGFLADFGIAFASWGSVSFELTGGSLNFLSFHAGREHSVSRSALGLTAPNFGFNWVSYYTSSTGWLSNEVMPGPALAPTNPGNVGTPSLTGFNRFEAVPEPATMAALGLGVAALLRRRKKA